VSLLVVDGVSKTFGGVAAIREATFTLEAGEILGIMGANGAGKTTLFNLISGSLRPDRGAIYLDGERIDGLRPDRVCRRGIARTYQIVRPFPGMTVRENVLVGALFGADRGRSAAPATQTADRILEDLDLADQAGKLAGELTLAARKRLEMARALATRPRILLLDEVLAGLNPTEVAESLVALRDIRGRHGVTLVIIEHVLRAVMDLCDRIVVFHHGERIAAGAPAEVVNDAAVIAAYLGASS
jgi:branched-chain amino acid transport system ATP-binding protein